MQKYEHGGNVWSQKIPEYYTDLSANINFFGPPKEIIEETKKAINSIKYYPDVTMKEATFNISEFLKVSSNCVLPTNGGIGAISLITNYIKADTAIILQPGFVEYERCANNVQSDIVHIPIVNNHVIAMPYKKIEKALKKYSLIYICNPINPVGDVFAVKDIKKVMELAALSHSNVLLDEAFISYIPEKSAKGLIEQFDNLYIAGSFTKLFAIPGIRLGYIISNEKNINELKTFQTPWTISNIASGITNAFSKLDQYIKKSLDCVYLNRKLLTKFFNSLGCFVYYSETNFILVDIKSLKMNSTELCKLLEEKKILVRNCSNYIGLDDYHIRVAVKSEKEIEKLIEGMNSIVRKDCHE